VLSLQKLYRMNAEGDGFLAKVNRAPPSSPSSPSSSSGSDYSPTPADDDASDQDFILDSGEEDEEDFTCKKRKVGPPPLDSAIEGAVFEPDLYILLRDIYENLSQEKRKAFCEFVKDLKTKREAEEIPSFREALLQQTPQVVGEDIWQHCIDIQRKEANPKPRGRPPNGLNGKPKVWNASTRRSPTRRRASGRGVASWRVGGFYWASPPS